MTENKPIIIDGVDIAECEDYGYRGNAGHWCHNYDEPCTDYPNCYYKQLKRKEQENEALQMSENEAGEIIAELKAENESLKENLKMFSSTLDWALKSQVGLYKRQIDSSVPDDWEYEEVLVLVEQYIEKLKQTLSEIKEIVEIKQKQSVFVSETVFEQIIQIISECEVK